MCGGGSTSSSLPGQFCSCKTCCQPYQANVGFSIGANNTDLLSTYINNEDWYPQIDGLVNNIGSKWWQIGDQVHLHINLLFTPSLTTSAYAITGFPVPIKVDTFASNGAIIEHGFTSPLTLENGQFTYDGGDLNSVDFTNTSGNFIAGDTYTVNAQIVYETGSI